MRSEWTRLDTPPRLFATSSLHLHLELHLRMDGALHIHRPRFVEHHRFLLTLRIRAEVEGLQLRQRKLIMKPGVHVSEMFGVARLDRLLIYLGAVFLEGLVVLVDGVFRCCQGPGPQHGRHDEAEGFQVYGSHNHTSPLLNAANAARCRPSALRSTFSKIPRGLFALARSN